MGQIKQDVINGHLAIYPAERATITPFLGSFDVTWGDRRHIFGTDLSRYFLKPEVSIAAQFGFDQEVLLIIHDFETLEPRNMQAADVLLADSPAKGRVDQSLFFIASNARDGRQWIEAYISRNPQSRFPVIFDANDLANSRGDAWHVRNIIGSQLFSRDLFDSTLPVDSDINFFGREAFVADQLDAIRRSQNRGLFGLRKTGKTSILYKLKRLVQRENIGGFVYIDCKLPLIRTLRWHQLLKRVTTELAESNQIQIEGKLTESRVAETFLRTLARTPENSVTALVFDEIEYISPLAVQDTHWRDDFIPFWQTLWGAQSQIRRLSNIVAGVNATVVETDVFNGIQNPMFGVVQSRYLRGMELPDMRHMVRFFGKRMGLTFTEETFAYLHSRYGGHPLLTRLACSQVNADVANMGVSRPYSVTVAELAAKEESRDAELVFYCRHVVSELKQFYRDEYEMLEMLAAEQSVDFMGLSESEEYIRHLKGYGLVNIERNGKPSIAIPVVGRFVATELMRKEGRGTRRRVVRKADRVAWVARRVSAIIRDSRELEKVVADQGRATLFGVGGFPEPDKVAALTEVETEGQFNELLNTLNRSFVESVERYGRSIHDSKYFWNTAKASYPDLWDALQHIKVYRHNAFHLELNATTEAELVRYLRNDLEDKRISQVTDVWFLLQQCVLDHLFIAIQCELNTMT